MPSFKDFKDLHSSVQNLLISLFSLPFWYVSLRLFTHHFFDYNTLTTILIFCFCLNLNSYLLIEINMSIMIKRHLKLFEEILTSYKFNSVSVLAVSANVFYISLFIIFYYIVTSAITYIWGFRVSYFYFCLSYFIFLIIILEIFKRQTDRKYDYEEGE